MDGRERWPPKYAPKGLCARTQRQHKPNEREEKRNYFIIFMSLLLATALLLLLLLIMCFTAFGTCTDYLVLEKRSDDNDDIKLEKRGKLFYGLKRLRKTWLGRCSPFDGSGQNHFVVDERHKQIDFSASSRQCRQIKFLSISRCLVKFCVRVFCVTVK